MGLKWGSNGASSIHGPFFDCQTGHAMELAGIVGDEHAVFSERMGCDHQIHTSNGLAYTLER